MVDVPIRSRVIGVSDGSIAVSGVPVSPASSDKVSPNAPASPAAVLISNVGFLPARNRLKLGWSITAWRAVSVIDLPRESISDRIVGRATVRGEEIEHLEAGPIGDVAAPNLCAA